MSETMNETMNDVTMTNKLTNNDMASNVTGPASSGSEGRSANPSVAMPRVVSIVGPTASGKTGLGIASEKLELLGEITKLETSRKDLQAQVYGNTVG